MYQKLLKICKSLENFFGIFTLNLYFILNSLATKANMRRERYVACHGATNIILVKMTENIQSHFINTASHQTIYYFFPTSVEQNFRMTWDKELIATN